MNRINEKKNIFMLNDSSDEVKEKILWDNNLIEVVARFSNNEYNLIFD